MLSLFYRQQTSVHVPKSSANPHDSLQHGNRISSAGDTQAPFGRALPAASRAASGEALSNVCFGTGFTCEAGPEAISGLHRQGEAMKSWLHAAYTSI